LIRSLPEALKAMYIGAGLIIPSVESIPIAAVGIVDETPNEVSR